MDTEHDTVQSGLKKKIDMQSVVQVAEIITTVN